VKWLSGETCSSSLGTHLMRNLDFHLKKPHNIWICYINNIWNGSWYSSL